MDNYDLHDVRIHGVRFSLDDSGYPYIIFDVDVWTFDPYSKEEGEIYFWIQPAELRYFKVSDLSIGIKCIGDPYLIIDQCKVVSHSEDSFVSIELINEGSVISFSAASSDLSMCGVKVRKKNVQYLTFHERACRS